ncbi:HAMP domain-containing sensor histidine kinase [Nitratidesulfovibrio liaohensis]|uniref:histidine kinase n=1 Tax=Nitratidesulfovibrio liaohensis TaxID=2604158 RepID=A0ABY9QXB7_9BACT|nr:HAMP domain-containing sensor histidine kinase [Nitratidesulfovibrio liaohensis]WMW63947.1 HAMP domain-containing histidine kinase [Nitratidesulfovibrio liaohensis]
MRTWPVRLLVLLLVGCGIFTLGTFVRFRLEDRPKRGPFEMNAVLLDLLGDRVAEYLAEGRTDKLDALLNTLRKRGVRMVVLGDGLQPLADNGPVVPVPFGPPFRPDAGDGQYEGGNPNEGGAQKGQSLHVEDGPAPIGGPIGFPPGPPFQPSWQQRILGALRGTLDGRMPPPPSLEKRPPTPAPLSPETEAAIQVEARELTRDARDTGTTQLDFPPPFTFRPAVLMADPIDLPGGGHGVLTLRKDMPNPPDMPLPPFVLPLALAMVLAGGVLHLLLRQTSRPIGEVGSALQRFARGDLQARVNGDMATHGTELARLARDFNTMAERTEELLQTQRRLLHDVSHEMRSPLSRVALALEMASRTVSPESQRFLERIRRDAERLSTLSAHLLATGHLDRQKEDEPPAWFDLQAMLTQLTDETDFQARADGKRVELRVDVTCASFHGMREMLYGAVDNVVQNALKFSPPGTQVTVALSRETDRAAAPADDRGADGGCRRTCGACGNAGTDNGSGPERRVVISVRDQGPGVPEADLPMLFVPFFRAGNAPRGTGTGLGLAIAQRAVELHGGTIAAENLPKDGLLVTIRLPA